MRERKNTLNEKGERINGIREHKVEISTNDERVNKKWRENHH